MEVSKRFDNDNCRNCEIVQQKWSFEGKIELQICVRENNIKSSKLELEN